MADLRDNPFGEEEAPGAGLALWKRALEDPQLKDLPYKAETNGRGQLVLTPRPLRHGILQVRIAELLREHVGRAGDLGAGWAVATPGGVRVTDVAWISEERQGQVPAGAAASPVAPELCVDLAFASGKAEPAVEDVLGEKRALYLAAGAEEVWIVGLDGSVRFYDGGGPIPASRLAPGFPEKLPRQGL